ncbi:MAG: IS66 family insertion sequence element accessory protein TnpB, partial [Methyloprofundus sp.]|nr:IS66 family insertion sequence element accessory protein TnpB [Methyloprofundus sp.]MBW6453259.1 IS66 family insertion sequence element accessory protein TnpB [Methyloprofundus sp.]
MLAGLSVNQVYLATGFTDMRKSINGLSLIVSEQLG